MKHIFLLALATIFGLQATNAQEYEEFGLFDHLGAGISVGTDGIGIDLAAPMTDYAALRAGVSFLPRFKYNTNIDLKENDPDVMPNVDIEGKAKMFDFKLLADFYPAKKSSFHITVGAFFGNGTLASGVNTSQLLKDPADNGKKGLSIGQDPQGKPYRITTDDNGYVTADVKVNKFKPYVGIGFGRAVPKKNRVSVSFDMGLQFWGKPRLGANTKDDWGNVNYHEFKKSDITDNDYDGVKDAFDVADKIIGYPVINIRINGRIF